MSRLMLDQCINSAHGKQYQSAPQDSVTGSAGALTSKPEFSTGHPIAKVNSMGEMQPPNTANAAHATGGFM